MAETLTSMIAQAWSLPTSYTITVADDHDVGGRSVTIGVAATTTYWRTLLASSSSPGTPSTTAGTYKDYLSYFQNQLNAGTAGGNYWTVTLNLSGTLAGYISIHYTGAGMGSITFDADPGVTSNVLGFKHGSPLQFTPGQTHAADCPPLFVVFLCSRDNASGYQPVPAWTVGGTQQNGVSYAFQGSSGFRRVKFDARMHPKDNATQVSRSSPTTPIHGASGRWYSTARINPQPTTTLVPPWGMNDFRNSVAGYPAGAVFDTLQTFTPGGSISQIYLDAQAMMSNSTASPHSRGWDVLYDWPGWVFNETAQETA